MSQLNARIITKASATSGEAPLAGDLEVAEIAVNTADGKLFTKHTDGTVKEISGSGGGGGAVDSVNGETGVVSLGIQDMDDVEDPPIGFIFDTNSAPNNPNSAGQWYVQGPGSSNRLYWCQQDANGLATSPVANLPSGSKIWLNRLEFTTTGSASANANYYTVEIVEDMTIVASGSDLAIATVRQLSDGDILRWSEVDQTFDYSSLEIQEADDFALNSALIAAYEFDTYGAGNYPQNDYEWCIYSNELRLWDTAADGTDLTAIWPTIPGSGTFWYSADSISFTEATYTGVAIQGNGYFRLIAVNPLPYTLTSGGLFVRFEAPGPPPGIPLAEGDILQWVAADQKFQPSSDYISLAALKAEVAAATDFADFQSRIAAL